MDGDLLKELTIPLFTGAIGYLTNWSGVWMLFYPVEFAGWRLPGLRRLAPLLPRPIQQLLPGEARKPYRGEDGDCAGGADSAD